MLDSELEITKQTYGDPELVQAYAEEHARKPKSFGLLQNFAKKITGKKVLDIGCGPGHDSYKLSELGFTVTGMDYSPQMVALAQGWKKMDNPPRFIVGDIRNLNTLFLPNSFDAALCNAVLVHIPKQLAPAILDQMHAIVKPGGLLLITLPGSDQDHFLLHNQLGGKQFVRLFIYWQSQDFRKLLQNHGFEIMEMSEDPGGPVNGKPTKWLRFIIKTIKDA